MAKSGCDKMGCLHPLLLILALCVCITVMGFLSIPAPDEPHAVAPCPLPTPCVVHIPAAASADPCVLSAVLPNADPYVLSAVLPNADVWGMPREKQPEVRERYLGFSPASRAYISAARKVYITYGDQCCAGSKARACRSALGPGMCDECHALDRSALDPAFQSRHADILSTPRGAGLWLWKPYIINKTLHSMRDGEYLIYADAGIYFVGPVHQALLHMEARDDVFHGVLLTSVFHPMFRWCKRDAFVRQRCDTDACHQANQIDGAFSFWRRGPHALRVANAWLADAADYASISDAANVEGLPNLEGFVDHRHDQAILTNVVVREGWAYQNDRGLAQLMSMFVHDRNKS